MQVQNRRSKTKHHLRPGERMAGLGALCLKNDSLVPLCSDGKLIEPLDAIHLLFPNKGPNVVGDNVCFAPRPFHVPLLTSLLPEGGDLFTPHDLVDAVVSLTLLCILVAVGLVVAKHLWELLDPQFRAITPEHKKWYVVANMSKAFFLLCMTFSTRFWIGAYKCFVEDDCQMTELKRCMMIYVATDTVALFMVPKLPTSTALHHIFTTLMSFVVCGTNLKIKGGAGVLGFCKMGAFYGLLSTVAFTVNAYLALRVVYPRANWVRMISRISLVTYVLLCAVNWSVHLLWFLGYWALERDFSLYTFLYMAMISFLINDDIILIKWLIRQGSPMASDHYKKQ